MHYRTIVYFEDLNDNSHPYNVGDVFPREGFEVPTDRLNELSGVNNRRGMPLIEKVEGKVLQKKQNRKRT